MIDAQVTSAVAVGNLKAISEQPAMLSNLAYANVVTTNNLGQQNAVANQQAIGELGIPLVAKATNTISTIGPMEARSAVDVLTNNELAQSIADLKAAVNAFAAPSGGSGAASRATLRALMDRGLRVDPAGQLVVPPGITILVPGKVAKEEILIDLQPNYFTVKVKANG
ncbi:hypothetical protein AVMA1855_18230 [Acidovorax sp. SUPP1855]|uniref:hypothetical protein n=1 Tax=Acidovorax sp. SUPP1855 TaxID=431774 RepID=UPI0023DE2012|nr:hypothetical protein [Acidovorax sp. SUPP1855]GKS86120.1 hypothetical protein AVMA1855_18230 [Acidovorax sp. SUPP1855]